MKLHFHGHDYEDPYIQWQIVEGDIGGTYRGVPWRVHRMREQHRIPPHHRELIYRGVHYTKD